MQVPMILVIYVHRITQEGQVESSDVLKNPWEAMTSIKEPQPIADISELGFSFEESILTGMESSTHPARTVCSVESKDP
jgi:hypothetical protein